MERFELMTDFGGKHEVRAPRKAMLNFLDRSLPTNDRMTAMMRRPLLLAMKTLLISVALVLTPPCLPLQGHVVDRRQAIGAAGTTAASFLVLSMPSLAADDIPYEARNRNGNKQALIREDYWYMMGKTPPRRLKDLPPDDPEANVWGSCRTDTGNSCTYVPLKQRIPAYSKYAFNIALGAKEYQQVGSILKLASKDDSAWGRAYTLVDPDQSPPPPANDALLKMALFASAMLTTPNYSGPPRDLLVARFYVNEADFATKEMARAIEEKDSDRALKAYEFGKDSWNSYLNIVNRGIVPKVGDPIPLIQ